MRRAWLLVLLAGCSSGSTGKPGGSSEDSVDSADTGSESAESASAVDEATLRAAIAGETDAEVALFSIANNGGLPIETADGTFLFACLCGDGDWAVAGDFDDWAGQSMGRSGELVWAEVVVEQPEEAGYKLTNGTDWTADPMARRYRYDDFGELSLVRSTEPHLERAFADEAYGLTARELRMFVPRDGLFTHMVVVHDGQNLFDPSAFHGGWQLDSAAADRPLLIVGIDNTAARFDEYTPVTDVLDGQTYGGRAADYAELVRDVRVAMEDRYGTADTTGVMGSSLGGLVSFAIADLQPGEWDAALSLSGTMGWGSIGANGPTILDAYAAAGKRDTVLYLDSGGGGTCVDADGDGLQDDALDGSDNYCENRQFADQLADMGYTWSVDLYHWHEAGAPHTEAAWAARVFRPLDVLMSL
jgi:hypothetical protein